MTLNNSKNGKTTKLIVIEQLVLSHLIMVTLLLWEKMPFQLMHDVKTYLILHQLAQPLSLSAHAHNN